VPYVLVEASHAAAPRHGPDPTRPSRRRARARAADLVLTVNPHDVAGVKARLRPGAHQLGCRPSSIPAVRSGAARGQRSAGTAGRRHDAHARQARSYRILAEALTRLKHKPWRALLVGDGRRAPKSRR